ncbi:MAG: RuBisCO large subunit C-terminal-like domain-containing protein [Nitrososphaeria archaeon]
MSEESVSIFTVKPEEVDPEKNVIATYYVEGRGISVLEAGVKIAAEESIGTWTEVTTETEWIIKNLPAKVFEYKFEGENTGIVKVAYPTSLFDFETGGIPNILSIVAGNLFGMGSLQNVKLLDIELPYEAVNLFSGPKFGIEGIRRMVGTLADRRPHLGTIIKPKVGLSPRETAKVAYEAAVGGVDFIKDDETLTNQKFCPLPDRVSHVMNMLDKAKSETGRTILYAPDITAETYKIRELAQVAIDNGANALMVDVIPCGFSAIRLLAEDSSIKVPIHVHRCMHAAMTRNPKHGVSMMVIAKLVRLAGGDQLHTGTAAGKMGDKEKKTEEVFAINEFLRKKFYNIKTTFPVASGGIHPAIVPANIQTLGKDIVIQAGGGIHGHPNGTREGATAMRQAIDATLRGIPLEEYAKDHKELEKALQHWGTKFLSGD